MNPITSTLLALVLGLTSTQLGASKSYTSVLPGQLRCEYVVNPFGVDVAAPRLGWTLASSERGQRQTAYQILVATSTNALVQDNGDMWDSGRVRSEATLQIPYAGKTLKSSQQFFWKVRIWDKSRKVSDWSQPAAWTMGLLNSNDWQGRWLVGPPDNQTPSLTDCSWIWYPEGNPDSAAPVATRYFRKQIFVRSDVALTNAILLLASDNSYAAYVNGTQIGQGQDFTVATPWAVTAQLLPGTNTIAISAANSGTTNNPAGLLGKLVLRYADGQTSTVHFDATWKAASQPLAGWPAPDFNDVAWTNALVLGRFGMNPWQTIVRVAATQPLPIFRREFTVKPGLRRALVFICGLGQYELSANGAKVGDALLAPGWTKYDRTCLYDTFDLTSQLTKGNNVVGVMLGNGMYNVTASSRYTKFTGSFGPPKVIAQIQLDYADGSTEIIGTDERWRTAPGPITFSSVFGGEDFDARLNPSGWDKSGFDSSAWSPAQVVQGPGGKLAGLSCAAPPLRAFETLKPVKTNVIQTNLTVYDLGQNAPIMAQLQVKGPAGSSVRIIPAELLNPDGTVDRRSCSDSPAWWQYTLSGDGDEYYFTKFFSHGCRYLQIERFAATNTAELPTIESIEGVVVHTASTMVGEFACSNDLFNRIHTLIRWAQRANLVSVLTDCPHRERLGWLEQYHLNGPSLRYEFDLAQLFTKGMNDMADSQLADGLVPDIAPEYSVFGGGFRDSPEWGSAFVIVPWQQYEFTGDTELLGRYYAGMKRYVAYLGTKAQKHIVSHGLGDWYDIGPKEPGPSQLTPNALTATAFYYYDTWILAQAAGMLGKKVEAEKFTTQANAIRAAFNEKFFNAAKGSYATGSQTANAIPLVMNLCEPTNRASVLNAIVADVRAHGNAITAGDVGYRYLLRALAEGGRSDVIFDMNNQSEKPGYGYQLKKGATSLTEAWDANPSSSQNHFMLGQIMEWFYGDLGGIAIDPASPGFKNILIHPQPVGDVTWAKCAYNSIHGRISVEWKKADGKFLLHVTIPANTTATIHLPTTNIKTVQAGGRIINKVSGIKFLRQEPAAAVFEVGSGNYEFVSE